MRIEQKSFLPSYPSPSSDDSDDDDDDGSGSDDEPQSCERCTQYDLVCVQRPTRPCQQCQLDGHRCSLESPSQDNPLLSRIRNQATQIHRLLFALATARLAASRKLTGSSAPPELEADTITEEFTETEDDDSAGEEEDVYWIAPESWAVSEPDREDVSDDELELQLVEELVLDSETRGSGSPINIQPRCALCDSLNLDCEFSAALGACTNCRDSLARCSLAVVPVHHLVDQKQAELFERIRKQEEQIQMLTARLEALHIKPDGHSILRGFQGSSRPIVQLEQTTIPTLKGRESSLRIYFSPLPLHLNLGHQLLRTALLSFHSKIPENKATFDFLPIVDTLPSLFEDNGTFESFCSVVVEAVRFAYPVESSAIDLVLVTTASWGMIHPFSNRAKQDLPLVRNTETLRTLLASDNPWQSLSSLPSRWSSLVAELLQIELNNNIDRPDYWQKCLTCLQKAVRQFTELPPSFFVPNARQTGLYPVAKGGFADIWRGHLGHQAVCIKVLRTYRSGQNFTKAFKDFAHEAVVWKQLHHKNVLPFLGVRAITVSDEGEELMNLWLISPWISNGSINLFLEKCPGHDRMSAVREILAGLAYLHGLQLVHGDLKGSNILVSDDGCCCLADFGLSVISESPTSLFSTATSNLKGSIRWLSPEVMEGLETRRSSTARDVYAFACTVLEIYSGQAPFFEIKHDAAVIFKVMSGTIPSRPQTGTPIPDSLWKLLISCWNRDPTLRPCADEISRGLG